MLIKWNVINLVVRLILINVIPFFMVFHMVMKRRRQLEGGDYSHVKLIAGELKIVGLLGCFVILSIYFFSIPVLEYINTEKEYRLMFVAPNASTVFIISVVSFYLVCAGIYLQNYKYWAFRLSLLLVIFLLFYAFFSILHYGIISIVPIVLFTYLLFRLTRQEFVEELEGHQNV